ncbi:hypothetical protein B0H10DRAFT_1998363 [Mycena sp. CBHHK59/15]|nr:hypothetical protein B0H10DRAFT_1998363 [Mycena sp. CBHHK59/15]
MWLLAILCISDLSDHCIQYLTGVIAESPMSGLSAEPLPHTTAHDLAGIGISVIGGATQVIGSATVQKIFDLAEQMRLNKRKAQLLASSSRESVHTLSDTMSSITPEELAAESALMTTISEFSG